MLLMDPPVWTPVSWRAGPGVHPATGWSTSEGERLHNQCRVPVEWPQSLYDMVVLSSPPCGDVDIRMNNWLEGPAGPRA